MASFRVAQTKGKKHSARAGTKSARKGKVHGIVRGKVGRVAAR